MSLSVRRRLDVLFVSSLVLGGVVLLLPLRGDYLLIYVDNPVHLAETAELIKGGLGSWSELDFCGLPLSTLHSPLLYGLLALLGRIGLPLTTLYRLALLAGTAAPSLALYAVARRRSQWGAWVAAALYMILPTNVAGLASAAGGMWTFHVGTALLVFFAQEVSAPWSRGRALRIGLLLGAIGLIHTFVLVAATITVVIAWFILAIRRTLTVRLLGADLAGFAAAALVSACYWGPILFVSNAANAGEQSISPLGLLLRLITPTSLETLLTGPVAQSAQSDLLFTDCLGPVGLILLAALAVARFRQRPLQPVQWTGLGLAVVVVALLLLASQRPIFIFGPVTWRFLSFAQLGLAMTADVGLAGERLVEGRQRRRVPAMASALFVLSCLWWNRPLALDAHPDDARDLADLRATWTWLKTEGSPQWSRIYVQDTYEGDSTMGLGMGHVTTLTKSMTGIRQLGAYYGVHPFKVGRFTLSEKHSLFGATPPTDDIFVHSMALTASDALLLAHPMYREWMAHQPDFAEVFQQGRFSVWARRRPSGSPWALPVSNAVRVVSTAYDQREVSVTVDASAPEQSVVLALSYHPWWVVQTPGVRLVEQRTGLGLLQGIPQGRSTIRVTWQPSRVWWLLTLAGVCLLTLMWARERSAMIPRTTALDLNPDRIPGSPEAAKLSGES
jgi:hypothetical protein